MLHKKDLFFVFFLYEFFFFRIDVNYVYVYSSSLLAFLVEFSDETWLKKDAFFKNL